ncbi:helix-turn-helix domain-containing protein [Kutzneria chonburiensis]|uniref:MerR family transcriptional regulator n=1 Tax=Kutzneria chonburiensis TaxID=1483604 RepID=A0ABV6MJY1_9PSEU|nr:MerR family transcriptional regulator [Kutzneria chonburiensis]
MRDDGLWTIDELSAGVAEALAAGYPGQTNGRVREVPDRRTIRWYTTIGLLDRPAGMHGRTALYGRRHLLQIVAIKRLQADGLTLAEVQERLLGAPEATLTEIARVPEKVPAREKFWAARPAAPKKAVVVPGIRLGANVTVLLGAANHVPDDEELAVIEAAAAPLLDTLRRLGLDPSADREG